MKWDLNLPIEQLGATIMQAREDYIESYMYLIGYCGQTHINREKEKDIIVRKTKYLNDKYWYFQDMKVELKRIGKARGETYPEAVEALTCEQRMNSVAMQKMDRAWDSLMMLDEVQRYMESPNVIAWTDLPGTEVVKCWEKDAIYQWNHSQTVPKKSNCKLSEEVISQILILHEQGLRQKDIAQRLGISADPVRKYIKERSNK